MSGQEQEPTLDIAHGDIALSKHLRNSLNLLRDKTDDPEFKNLVYDITAGRKSVRDIAASPTFSRVLDPLVGQAVEQYRSMSEQEREELAEAGKQQFEAMRQNAERPSARRRAQPDGPDDDFSDQSWLR